MKNFKMNASGARQLLKSEGVRRELERRAEKVRQRANDNAPVGETGNLSKSHEIETEEHDRTVVKVYSNLDYAIAVEANTGYLSEALDAGGDS